MLMVFRKLENFIRTKYESKRWVMDGPMPDPATLDTEGDDDVVKQLNRTGLGNTELIRPRSHST